MKTLAILAGLAVASPLYAQPRPDYDRKTDEAIRDRDRGWVDLTANVEITGHRQMLPVSQVGKLSRLRIAASAGRPYIDKIEVHYRSGQVESYAVHRTLHRPGDSVDVALRYGGREIERIVVYTPDQHRGSYSILGE